MSSVFLESKGNGQPLVLIHGFCEDSRVWSEITTELVKNYKVIVIDVPGFGKSPLNASDAVITLDDMAIQLKETLVANGIDKCTMIGHSMGGYISLAFAERYPELLNGFGLFHSSAKGDTDFKKENRLKHVDFVKRNGIVPFVKTLIPSLFSAKYANELQIEKSLKMASECSIEGVVNALLAMRERPERLNVLKESKVPVLIIAGEDDTVVLKKDLAYQASLPNCCQFELLHNSGHMGIVEEAKRSIEIINEFMGLVKHYTPSSKSFL